jgi:DNA polymerase I-like protein with 3'-5' exonuclease and polymerase domains
MLKNNIQKLLESKDITINSKNIHLLNKAALINGYIHYPEYILIEKLNFLEKQNYPLPIKNYLEKKRILLSRKFGLETKSSGQSKFAQQKRKNKSKLTRRNYLYQNYSGTQIINMASIFERLQYYLTADAGKVILYKEGEEIFVRDLSSMEIYCTAINTFRLSMEELKLNTFIGAPMQYTDIVMAGYELNVISAEELEEVLKIEDIWNPKKTIFQKIMNWVEPLGMVGSVLLVPPYNVVFGVVFSLARSVSNLKRGEGEKLHNIINCN